MAALTYCLCMGTAIVFTCLWTISWCVQQDMNEEYMRKVNRPDTIEDEEQREKT